MFSPIRVHDKLPGIHVKQKKNPLAHAQGAFNVSIPFEEALQFYLYLLFFLQF